MSGLFSLPPGVDFAAGVAAGLARDLAGKSPEIWGRTLIFVPTARMRAAVLGALAQGGARLLPRVRLLDDLAPAATSPLRRQLELAGLIAALLDRAPDLAPRAALFDLADSLARLVAEMQGEGVAPETLAALDAGEHAAHWQRMAAFLRIAAPLFAEGAGPAAMVQAAVADLAARPPEAPVIVAGSTGSHGVTLALMAAVAQMPQGAVILPGFDPMPQAVWDRLDDPMTAEDHPQFLFRRLFDRLGCGPEAVRPWVPTVPPDPDRNALVSLALRPAPVTDQWLVEGALLPELTAAAQGLTLIEAADPRAEALAIALVLRQAAEVPGLRAVLVTPDRTLARRVAAALDRWDIRPDDSAGRPLSLSAPGRLIRLVAQLADRLPGGEELLSLLTHPLAASGADRAHHLRLTRALELQLRARGPAYPDAASLRAFAGRHEGAEGWGDWLAGILDRAAALRAAGPGPLADRLGAVVDLAEALAAGPGGHGAGLWADVAGAAALAAMQALADAAPALAVPLSGADLVRLIDGHLATREVRDTGRAHPRILIRGTREIRAEAADLMILGGLNEGTWPALPAPDPWLNRSLRAQAGLVLPERQIGLSAHDWQIAVAAPRVVLSRALRDDEAQTVPARWLNRLTNLMAGLPDRQGPQALGQMRVRGDGWLALAAAVERPVAEVPRATRPAPAPPPAARPRQLSVTEVKTLIRDPFAIYARHVLGLQPLNPLQMQADARLRGSVLHKVLERFVQDRPPAEDRAQALARLAAVGAQVLADEVPWPAARVLWQARLDRAAPQILDWDAALGGQPVVVEAKGALVLADLGFTLTGRPDRIDELPDGRLRLFDYKTGAPPAARVQRHFDKQLLLLAAMVEQGGFAGLGAGRQVASAVYLGLGAQPKMEEVATDGATLAAIRAELRQLVACYQDPDRGYPSRRAMQFEEYPGDYDHLARLGEWDMTEAAVTLRVGDHD